MKSKKRKVAILWFKQMQRLLQLYQVQQTLFYALQAKISVNERNT